MNKQKTQRVASEADIFAGKQLKKLRKAKKLSQKELAQILGVTFQQVQKYEKGINRMGAGRMYEACAMLEVSPLYFFNEDNSNIKQVAEEVADISITTELLLQFKNLPNVSQKKVLKYARALQVKKKNINKNKDNI